MGHYKSCFCCEFASINSKENYFQVGYRHTFITDTDQFKTHGYHFSSLDFAIAIMLMDLFGLILEILLGGQFSILLLGLGRCTILLR